MSEINDTSHKILIDYLEDFLPADVRDSNSFLKSSRDIREDLEDMCDISIQDISEEMLKCGYNIVVDDDHKPKWLMTSKS